MKTNKNQKQNKSSFELVSKILIAILIIAVISQIAIMISIKIKADNLKDKNNQLPSNYSVSSLYDQPINF